MKGHLYKKVMPSGWYVAYTADDFGFHKTELPLHPDDVNQIDEMSKIFDNVDARYHNQEVEFETVKKFMSDETLWFAKLINTKEKQKQETLYTEEDMLNAFYQGWEAKNLIWKEAKKQFKESLKEFKKD
jgi:hypothetical protein